MARKHIPLRVIYTGALLDLSGYAAAAREYIRALDSVGVGIVGEAKRFEHQPQHLVNEVVDRRLWSLIGTQANAPVQIIHLTPDNYREYAHINRQKIGYYAWETSRLPVSWVQCINQITKEAWVPCEYLRRISIDSGVTVPVRVIPHAIPIPPIGWEPQCSINGLPQHLFKFYSIFQWSGRKNGIGALTAYYREFSRDDPVIFVIKTYRAWDARHERDSIRRDISRLKRATKGYKCPPVLLIEEFLGANDVKALHHFCDCYVSMSRSEGFGLPAFEAAAHGNPVIVPNYSSFPEHFNEGNAYPVDVPQEISVRDMKHISVLYTSDMVWGDPSIEHCQVRMREVFNHRGVAEQRALAAKKHIATNLSHEVIGRMMKGHIETITKELSEKWSV